ncbi:hypothetical protein C2845_PM16G10240 [Panicum miliaceum]|uniref:Uncharacterized protein n=1 Tax=Panicum miliaceum TaxID=4540 RepID=A0A3L6PV21_PANMI|nr:hypothetical protein C2845_PM16G10240 [Panicum miliaceum]
MAASPALLSLTPAVSRHAHLLFSRCPSPRHLRLAPPAAASSPGGSPGPGVFLSPRALSQLDELAAFRYEHAFPHGLLTVRALTRGPEDDAVAEALVRLLASSFSETARWAPAQRYAQLLTFVIRSAAVLVGFYRPADAAGATEDDVDEGSEDGEGKDEGEMACTAEVSFDAVGTPGAQPTPTPPLDFPYICNMTVKTALRRIIDQVPFNMYRKSGYKIVETDSILVWLSLQKRKYLMSKELPQASVVESSTKDFDDNILTR